MWRRYTCVRQTDETDCGPAVLATLALHHGRAVSREQLRELTGTDRSGTSLLGLLRAAERLGFVAKAVKASYDGLCAAPLPAVAHVAADGGSGHFVVVHRAGPRGVLVADPALGIGKRPRDEFVRSWSGHLLLAAPDPVTAAGADGAAAPGPWHRFLRLLGEHTPLLLEGVFCALLMTLLGLGSSFFVKHLVDSVLVGQETGLLNALGGGMVLVIVFRTLFGALRQYLVAFVGRKVDLSVVAAYGRHVLRLPLAFFEARPSGEVLARVQDASYVREAVSGTTLATLVDGLLVVLLVGVLLLFDFALAAVTLAFVPVLVGAVAAHHAAVRRGSRAAMAAGSRFLAHFVEGVAGVETVKACGAERRRAEEGEERLAAAVNARFALQKVGLRVTSLAGLAAALAGLAVLWYGGHRVLAGALTVGDLMFFSSVVGYLLDPLERLASVNTRVQEALVAVERLYQTLDAPAESTAEPHKVPFTGLCTALELRDVTFRYGHRGDVLSGLTLRIPAGQTVAVVGESGSGKSTLVKLLLGFYAPTGGCIRVDGTDLRDIDLASLRQRIGLVSQDPYVFSGTLRENIALGRPTAPLAEVAAAARAAGLEEFVNDLPERYDTMIGERGVNLSGGQRQRLAIARALLRRPDLLVFDEATSHLDTATERAIQQSLRQELAGRTVVLVAHRLSTVRDADLICVVHHGRVVESGTHDQLIAGRGRYAALWWAQTESRAVPPQLAWAPGPEVDSFGNGVSHEGASHA
jgi:ATP-binding cassette, subfamily C, bacteriocin exporter